MNRWHKTDWLILASLILIAAFFRVWRLDSVPPGFQFDEAYNASDALRIIAGERPLFFEANGGREALYVYWIAPFVATFGATAFALRLASAVIGIATVALSYVLWRRMLPPTERLVAALAALLMATSYWHIHFSRYGIRAITLPLLLTATCYCLWDALPNVTSDKWHVTRKVFPVTCHSSLVTLVLCGFFLGLSIYAHPAARFVPIIITLWIAYSRFANRQSQSPNLSISNLQLPTSNFPSLISTFALIALTAFIIFVPLGYYFLNHPDQFIGHPKAVVSDDMWQNVARVAGMFVVRGDEAWIHNLAGRPVFDWISGAFFVVGLIVWARKIVAREPVAVSLLIWIPIMLLPTLLSDDAPNFSRAIGIMPGLFVIPAWGIATLYAGLRKGLAKLRITHHVSRIVVAALLTLSALFTFNDYFAVFPARPETFVAFDVDKIEAANYLLAQARTDRVFIAPLLAQHATFELVTRNAGFKSFDNGEVIVLPARDGAHGMTYAFPPDADREYVTYFAQTYGALAHAQTISDARGQLLLLTYRITPQDIPPTAEALPATLPIAPQRIVNANFDDTIRFVGYRIAAPTANPVVSGTNGGEPYQLTLVWQALHPIKRDYTLFIHLTDANGKRIAQRDRRPGNGSYPTTVWSPGDIVVEMYDVNPQNATGALQFAVGWYDPVDGTRAPVRESGSLDHARGNIVDDKVTFAAEATQ